VIRKILVAALVGVTIACGSAPSNFPRERLATPSLPSPGEYSVFLPPSYSAGRRSYPVLYFLHDAFGDGRVLLRKGVVGRLDEAMRSGALPEFLIVCPEGDGSWFSNSYDGRRLYEDFVVRDLRREIERRYRVLPGIRNRGITGISMGGYAAVKLALRHPDEFGSVSGLSAATIPISWRDVENVFWIARRQLHRAFGDSPVRNSLESNDVWRLLDTRPSWQVPFEVFLLAGREDKYRLDRVAVQYADLLNRRGIRATARVEPGIHDWPYWRNAMLEIARWHGAKFEAAR